MPNEPYQPKPPIKRTHALPGASGRSDNDTVPDLAYGPRPGASHDTVPEQAGVYVPPQPLAPVAEHRTMEIAAVRLSQEVDPRRAMTQLRISRPPPRPDRNVFLLPLLLACAALVAFVAHRISLASSASVPAPAIPAVPAPATPVRPAAVALPEAKPATEPPRPIVEAPAARAVPAAPVARARAEAPSDVASSGSVRPPEKAREPWLE